MFKLVEKKNHNAVHGIFGTEGRAKSHLKEDIPNYCKRGLFLNKGLKPEDFEIIEDSGTISEALSLLMNQSK